MSNYNLNINLQQLPGAAMVKCSVDGVQKTGVFLPVDENEIYVGQKGWYLKLNMYEMNADWGSHSLRLSKSSPAFKALTQDEKKIAAPYCGNARVMPDFSQAVATAEATVVTAEPVTAAPAAPSAAAPQVPAATSAPAAQTTATNSDDLPF